MRYGEQIHSYSFAGTEVDKTQRTPTALERDYLAL